MPSRRCLNGDECHRKHQNQVQHKTSVVDIERHIPFGINNTNQIADQIADKGCKTCTGNTQRTNQQPVQNQVDNRSNQTCPKRVGGMLRSRINTAEELIQTHHKDGNNQNRRISVGIRIFCVSAGTNQQVGKRTDKHNQNRAGNDEKRLISRENLFVEVAAVCGVVFQDGGHVPRLIEYCGNSRNQVRQFGGNAVDTGGSIANQIRRSIHIPQKQPVRKSCYQPQQRGWNQRNGKANHQPCHFRADVFSMEIFPKVCNPP